MTIVSQLKWIKIWKTMRTIKKMMFKKALRRKKRLEQLGKGENQR
jgi:hypothetical protein